MDNNLVDIIRGLIAEVNTTLNVVSIVVDKIYLNNTLHLTIDKIAKDSAGNEYKIIDFVINEWVQVEPINHAFAFAGPTLTAPDLTYLHGDPKSTNTEYLQKTQRTRNKTPFIWLVESYSYDLPKLDSAINGIYDVRLFVMDWANTPKWVNDEHNDYVIKPMENLIRVLLQIIEDDFNFKSLENVKQTVRPRFGDKEQRPDALVIDEDLSGLDLSFKIEVYETGCENTENIPTDLCLPALENTRDSDGNLLYSNTIISGGVANQTISDASNTLNGNPIAGIVAQGSKSITLVDDLGVQITPTVLSDTKTNLNLEIVASSTGLNNADLMATGENISYITNDDGDKQFGRDFLILEHNNPYGDTERFKDDLGTQIYSSDVIVDWSTFNQVNNTVLAYYRILEGSNSASNHVNSQPFTKNLLSDWWMVNNRQLYNAFNHSVFRNYLNYSPFNIVVSATSDRIWTSNFESPTFCQFFYGRGMSQGSISSTYKAFLCRTYTLTELGL